MTLPRRTEMKRTEWKRRPAEVDETPRRAKKRKGIKPRSDKRTDQLDDRGDLRREQLRLEPRCAAEIPMICTTWATEVNELKRGGQRATEYLIRAHTESLCHNCHAFITARANWARHHGHQVTSEASEEEFEMARRVRRRHVGCEAACEIDHREDAA